MLPYNIQADRKLAIPPRPNYAAPVTPDRRGAIQPRPTSSGNPFADMLKSAMGEPPSSAAPSPDALAPPIATQPRDFSLASPVPMPVVNALSGRVTSNFVGDQGGTPPPGGDPNQPPPSSGTPPPTPPPPTSTTPPPSTSPPPNAGWNMNDWAKANDWYNATKAQYGEAYKWLLTTPSAIGDYTRDAENLKALGIQNLDFTDWARAKGYNSPIDRNSFTPDAGYVQRGGTKDDYQTYVNWMAEGAAKYGTDAMRPYAQILSQTPGFIRSYMQDMNRAKAAGIEGINFVDWLKYQNGAPSPLAGKVGQESADAMARFWALDHGGTGAGPEGIQPINPPPGTNGGPPLPPPNPTPSPTGGPVPPPPVNPIPPPGPPQPVPPPVSNGDPTLPNSDDILRKQISDFESRTNPLFQRQRDDIQRRTDHAASLTGAISSGGYGETLNDALSQQYAQEQSTTAPEITKLTLAAQANALQKFSIDMNAILQREQIRSNADLETAAQALQKYGIDKNDLLDRYKAELGLKGIQYSSDRQVDAAALQAAAAHAAANAQAEASKYAANLNYQGNLFQGDINRENNIMDYILGIASLGPEWAKLILGSDPFGMLTGNPPSGSVIVKP